MWHGEKNKFDLFSCFSYNEQAQGCAEGKSRHPNYISIRYYPLSYFLTFLFSAIIPLFLCPNYLPYKQPAPNYVFPNLLHTKIYLSRQSWLYMLLLTITVNTDNNSLLPVIIILPPLPAICKAISQATSPYPPTTPSFSS